LENEIKLMHNFGFFDISLSKKMKEEDMINWIRFYFVDLGVCIFMIFSFIPNFESRKFRWPIWSFRAKASTVYLQNR
jgi:uncharacterized protein YbgA (DUF1722 family)